MSDYRGGRVSLLSQGRQGVVWASHMLGQMEMEYLKRLEQWQIVFSA